MLSASLPPVAGTLLFIAIEALVVDTKAGDKPDWSVVTSMLDIVLYRIRPYILVNTTTISVRIVNCVLDGACP